MSILKKVLNKLAIKIRLRDSKWKQTFEEPGDFPVVFDGEWIDPKLDEEAERLLAIEEKNKKFMKKLRRKGQVNVK